MASSYGYIKKGASGDTVKWIQEALGIDPDGKFGPKTRQAVKDFQAANGLQVDGIVGNETMEHLLGKGNSGNNNAWAAPTGGTANWLADYEGNRPSYSQSQAVKDAADMLAQYEGNKPGPYESSYAEQIQQVLDKILNREDFSYDFNADPLYQQYAQRYQQQGKLAMMDTMGQAAALTGGYGNSYAQSVGQQAYQGYLQGLNDILPQLRDTAYQAYRDAGSQLYNQAGLLQGLESQDYGKYRDTVGDYYNDLNYYYNKYNGLSDSEYNRYLNDLSAWQADRSYYYGKQQDQQAQSNWQAEFDFSKQQAAKTGGGGRGSGGSGGSARASSDRVKLFNASILTQSEYARRNKRDGASYKDYVDSVLRKWLEEKKLSDADTEYLISYYGLA